MRNQRDWSRRQFLGKVALAGTAALLGLPRESAAVEPPPETTTLRLGFRPGLICHAPLYLAEEFLRAEGFTDVGYINKPSSIAFRKAVADGEAQFHMGYAATTITLVDAGDPIILLAGIHTGCLELFGTNRVRAIRDLKGKVVSVLELGGTQHVFLSSMAAYVGLDPRKEINWVTHSPDEATRLLAEGRIDAFLAVPPQAQELRARKIGHVVVNTMTDRPWSQYFCCFVAGNREFVRKHPVATKRAVRAILKAADTCGRESERTARFLVEKGHRKAVDSDYVLQAMNEMKMAYTQWRDYDPEDTIRFLSLRLREAGMIKSSPQKIIAEGTDWRFLKELKKEMKG